MGLAADLGTGPVALDTAPIIYFIEEHAEYLPIVQPIFAAIAAGRLQATTSGLTLLETLVQPYRAGNGPLADQYEAFLTRSRGLHLQEITRAVCRSAAQIRAAHHLKMGDAIQVATALLARCQVFLTNDRDIPEIPGIRILQVKSYLPTSKRARRSS
jgi:predicted nucleic acid-binding protein